MKRGFALRFCYGAKGVEKHGENSQIMAAAGVLMLLAGAIFGFMRQWICAGLLWVGAFGCLIAALNFKKRKNEES